MRSFLDKQSSSEYPTERTSAVLLDEKKTKIEPCAQRKTAAFSSHLMIKYSINKAALTRRVLLGHLITYILCNFKKQKLYVVAAILHIMKVIKLKGFLLYLF